MYAQDKSNRNYLKGQHLYVFIYDYYYYYINNILWSTYNNKHNYITIINNIDNQLLTFVITQTSNIKNVHKNGIRFYSILDN